MAYKFQKGAFHADGLISGSSTGRLVGSISSSGDLAVTGAIHSAQFYGGGAGITGISADAIDVTASTGDQNYRLVFTQDAQSDGSLGLGLNTGLVYNPNDAVLSSSAGIQAVGAAILGNSLKVSGSTTLASSISGSGTAYFGGSTIIDSSLKVSSSVTAVGKISGSSMFESVTGLRTAGSLSVTGSTTLQGSVSSSQGARFVGNVEVVGQLKVTGSHVYQGSISSSANISTTSQVLAIGHIQTSGSFKTDTTEYRDTGITVDSAAAAHYIIKSEVANKQVRIMLGSNDTGTAFGIRNASGSLLMGVNGSGSLFLQGKSGAVISSSIGGEFVSSLSSSGDLAVTGAVHAAQFYGGGSGITGISSDAVDVTASTADVAYPIVFTQAAQADGTLGLALNTALNFNPSEGILSSSAELQIANDIRSGKGLYVTSSISGGAGAQFVGAAILGNTLKVSGAATFAAAATFEDQVNIADGNSLVFAGEGYIAATSAGSGEFAINMPDNVAEGLMIRVDGDSNWMTFKTSTGAELITSDKAFAGSSTISGASSITGHSLSFDQGNINSDAAGNLAATSFGDGTATMQAGALTGVTTATLSGLLSSSAAAQIVGATTIGSNLGVTGAISLATAGGGVNFDGGTNVMKITNNGGNTMGFGGGLFTFNNKISGSGDLEIVGNGVFVGDLDVSGGVSVGDSASDVMAVKASAYFAGPEAHKLGTITAATELTASSDRSYQIVSGGTSALTVIMPSASNSDYSYMIKRHSLMSGNVVIEGGASEKIDGNTNITLSTVGASVFLISDGTQWNIF